MRAATAPELAKLRGDGQAVKLYLAFADTPEVFRAQVNGTFATTDQVTSIPFDNVTVGAYTALLENMTLFVGSTAGGYDLGMARVKSATASTIKIARTSDISWADNIYLTAIRDFGLWAKQPTLSALSIALDDDVSYTDQLSSMNPVPVMGPDALIRLSGGTVSYSPDGSLSWVPGSTISAYSWACAGAAVTGGTTATPTITLTAAGTYDLTLTVTAANGKTTTGHRTLRVVGSDPGGEETPITEFNLDSLQGDLSAGGWSASVTLYAQAEQSAVRDRAKVFIYADDFYAGNLSSLGQLPGLEPLLFVGWIDGESIEYDRDYGTVQFSVQGPAYWLGKLGSTATIIEPVTAAPKNWNEMQTVTLSRLLWYVAFWRSTAAQTIDILQPSITTEFGGALLGMGTVWSQLTDAATNRLLCEARCDRYGRLSVDRDPQCMTTGERAALPVVMAFTQDDCQERIDLERKTTPDTGVLELSGLMYSGGNAGLVLSRASGWALKRYGKPETRDRVVAIDQDDANRLAGCLQAKANNPYPRVTLKLAENNRMVDIAPASYCTLSIAAGDTPRGITWTNQRIIPRKITWSINENGAPTTSIEFEPEVQPALAVAVDVPTIGKINVPPQPGLPTFPFSPFGSAPLAPPVTIPEPPTIPDTGTCPIGAAANGPFPFFIAGTAYSNNEESAIRGFLDGKIRARGTGAANPTTLIVNCIFEELSGAAWVRNDSATWATAYLLDEFGNRLCTGVWSGSGSQRTITFSPPANTPFTYIEIGAGLSESFTPSIVGYDRGVSHSGAPTAVTYQLDSLTWRAISGGLQANYVTEYTMNVDNRYDYAYFLMTAEFQGLVAGSVNNMDISANVITWAPPGHAYQQAVGVYGWGGGGGIYNGAVFKNIYGAVVDVAVQGGSFIQIQNWAGATDPAGYADGALHYAYISRPPLYQLHAAASGGNFFLQALGQRMGVDGGVGKMRLQASWTVRLQPTRRVSVTSAILYNVCSL